MSGYSRILKDGESQRSDGRYMYRHNDIHGNRKCVYAPTLKELREKELQIRRDLEDGIDTAAGEMTLGELLDLYLSQKTGLRKSTVAMYKSKNEIIKKHRISTLQIKQIKKTAIVWNSQKKDMPIGLSRIVLSKSKAHFHWQLITTIYEKIHVLSN